MLATRPSRNPFWMMASLVLLLAVGTVLVLASVVPEVLYQEHAVLRHGMDAELVRRCIEDGRIHSIWRKPDGRIVIVCRLPDGRWGVQIRAQREDGRWVEITSFIKNRMRDFAQVERWLRNQGAEVVQWILGMKPSPTP